MIIPARKDDLFLEDVARARHEMVRLHLWWLGQSGFLLQWRGHHLLFDPYLSDSLTRKYAGTDKPHVRMTERVIAPDRLDFIEVVTSSHHHTDHLDPETLLPLLRANPAIHFIIPEANRTFVAERLQLDAERPIGLDAGGSVRLGEFQIDAVPAAHELLEQDQEGRQKFLGYVVRCGPWSIYHSGDTVQYPGMVELLRTKKIRIALLPINGRAAERRVAGNLDGPEAARLAKEIDAELVVPCHYQMFEFNTASPERFVQSCEELGQAYRVLRPGDRWSSVGE